MENTPSPQSMTVKLASMCIIILADLILNSFVEAAFSLSLLADKTVNFYLIPIQILMTVLILVMVLVMMWQTFPLRYGLIGTILSEFKYTFLVLMGFLGATALERGYKLSLVIGMTDYTEASIWNDGFYGFTYYLRYISYPFFYAFMVNFCVQILNPSFYRPKRWLK